MSVPTEAATARSSLEAAGVLDRLRAHSLALDIGIVSSVSLVLGLLRLGAPSVWIDESYTARAADQSYASYVEVYHWLYYSMIRPWMEAVGTGEAALRFPSVVGAMLASALVVLIGRRLFDRWVALVAGLLTASSPFVVKWSQQARGYTFLLALAALSMLLLLRALDRNTRRDWALYGLAFAAVVVWHPVGGFLLAPAQLVLAYQRRDRVAPHGLLAVLIICALGVPWAAQIAMRSTGEGVAMNWLKFPSPEVAARAVVDVSGGMLGLGLVLAVAGLVLVVRARRRDASVWLGTWAFAPFVLALVVSTFRPIYLDRYLIVAAPAFALLAGVAIMGVGRRWRVALVAAIVLATGVGLLRWYAIDGNWRGEDWRGAVRAVNDRQADGDVVLVAPWSAASAARYYGAEPMDVSTADRIWVIVWSETGNDITTEERRALGFRDHVRVEKLEFGRRVSAQLWRRPS